MSNPVQFGLAWGNPRRRLAKKANEVRVEQARQRETEAESAKARELKRQAEAIEKEFNALKPQIRQALAETLYRDEKGPFQGWHLLKMISKSKEQRVFDESFLGHLFPGRKKRQKGTARLAPLRNDFGLVGAEQAFSTLLKQFAKLGLVKVTERGYHAHLDYAELTPRGREVLDTFKKDVQGGMLRGRRGNYTFNDAPAD